MLFTRPDGTLAKDIAPVRRIMPFLMKGRNESAVYFEQRIDLSKTQPFIDAFNQTHPETKVTFFHVFLWAAIRAFELRPRMNRFVVGSKVWQRDGIWISYSAKKRLDDDSPLVVLKRKFEPGTSFDALVEKMYADLREGRSNKKSHVDNELSLFLKIPAPLLRWGVALLRWLDDWNLLPGSFIHPDPMYASLFIANLGSVRLDSAYHHLYEYGSIPLFAVIGRTLEGSVSVKYTFDERIEDGLYAAGALSVVKALCEDPSAATKSPEELLKLVSTAR